MWRQTRHILEMIRFSHTVFALPFALLAAVIAWRVPTTGGHTVAFHIRHLVGMLLCMVCARSAAMAFNRLVDREIDAGNPRTRQRHLVVGSLSVPAVRLFTLATAFGFVAATLLFWPNYLPLVLSVPVLGWLFGYSYAKRFTSLSHFWLGTALMLAPVSVWIALRGEAVLQSPADILPAIVLGLSVLLWVAGFDIIYACQDAEFDASVQLRSVPAKLGVSQALRVAALCHLLMVLVLATLPFVDRVGGPSLPLGWIYFGSLVLIGLLLVWEHLLVKPHDLSRVNVAFFQINALISFGLLVVVTLDLFV